MGSCEYIAFALGNCGKKEEKDNEKKGLIANEEVGENNDNNNDGLVDVAVDVVNE